MKQIDKHYPHRNVYYLHLNADADERSPGAAVTVALCGHWEHDGSCRWPHYSSIAKSKAHLHRLIVEFDAPPNELEEVSSQIQAALAAGQLKGPDGHISIWQLIKAPDGC